MTPGAGQNAEARRFPETGKSVRSIEGRLNVSAQGKFRALKLAS